MTSLSIKDGIDMNYTVIKANEYIKANLEKVNNQHRHRFHLMPEVGWMNDPNGFIFFQGYYHLFYQFYPYEAKWGPMHWGHARSKNLIDWEHLPVALAPDLEHEDGCFSGGSIVIDDKLYLMYTSHFHQSYQKQEQSLAISTDGIHFMKYQNAPVITLNDLPIDASRIDFRDPNPVTIDKKHFVLIGSSTTNKQGQILVYRTDDFKTFQYLNSIKHPYFGEIAECPDLFELDGKHVLLFSATNLKTENYRFKNVNSSLYAIGNFNTETGEFLFEHVDEIDAGHHYYAPQTLENAQQRTSVAWMEMWGKPYYTALSNHAWAGAMTLPRTLRVINNRLYQTPISLDNYVSKSVQLNQQTSTIISKHFILEGTVDSTQSIQIRIGSPDNHVELSFNIREITLDTSHTVLFPLEKRSILHDKSIVEFTLIMDNSSLELFIHGLDKTITTRVYFNESELALSYPTHLIQLNYKELNK
jgi:beta-fructofuranosidase